MDPLHLNIFDSDEDEFVEDIVLHRHPKVFKNRINYLEEYDDFACNIVTHVTEAIASLLPRYIKFPETHAEKQIVKEEFYRIARFPHVIGAIDGTHIRINSPGGVEAERYRNRKGYFSWNVQTICDAKLRITNIVAR